MSEKFYVESDFTYFKPTTKERTSIRVNPASWEWMQEVRARTGISVVKLVDKMVEFCSQNLEIVPKGSVQKPESRMPDELLCEAAALLQEAARKLGKGEGQ